MSGVTDTPWITIEIATIHKVIPMSLAPSGPSTPWTTAKVR